MAIVPTVMTRNDLISVGYMLTDAVAVATMLVFGAALGALVWTAGPPRAPSSATADARGRHSAPGIVARPEGFEPPTY